MYGSVALLLIFLTSSCTSTYSLDQYDMCDLPIANASAVYANVVNQLTQNGTRVVNVCGYQVTPICACVHGGLDGFMPDLWSYVAGYIGLNESMYRFICVENHATLIAELTSSVGACDVSVADNDILPEYIAMGIRYPLALVPRGLKVVISNIKVGSYWSFLDAFSGRLWVAFVLTLIIAAFILYTLERFTAKESELIGEQGLGGLLLTYWCVLGQAVGVAGVSAAQSVGARLTSWSIGFMVLVLISLFTANTTAFVTTRAVTNDIQGFSDLVDQVVGTWEGYKGLLDVYSPKQVIYMPWTTVSDEIAMVKGLVQGNYNALVIDGAFANYAASVQCGITTVGTQIDTVPLSLALAPRLPLWVSLAFTHALSELQDNDNLVQNMIDDYLAPPPLCPVSSGSNLVQVKFLDVAGLWFILAGAWGIGWIASFISLARRKGLLKGPGRPEEAGEPIPSGISIQQISGHLMKAKSALIGHTEHKKRKRNTVFAKEVEDVNGSGAYVAMNMIGTSAALRESAVDVVKRLAGLSNT